MMYSHSVTLDSTKCVGCTDCIKRCPTEAIRVKASKAKIIEERCIDCGNCISVCRNGAKKAVTDKVSMLEYYTYKVALPAPAFYAQFSKANHIDNILASLYQIGFTDVVEVSAAAEIIARHSRRLIEEATLHPVISSACPVILRLIQRRFPSLIHHILPIMSPMELASRYIKHRYKEKGIDEKDVGVFFITPCPGKVTDIHKPKGFEKSYVDGAFSMQEIYKLLGRKVSKENNTAFKRQGGYQGLTWAMRSGATENIGINNHIAVDGIENVIAILSKIEDGTLDNVQYVEALACTGGCLGGALTIENPFISKYTLKKLIEQDKKDYIKRGDCLDTKWFDVPTTFEKSIDPRPVFSLDDDIETALTMLESIESLYNILPRIDCGSCGAPTCKCFAEDVVKGVSNVEDCVFMLRKRIKELSESMLELTRKVLPTEEI